jgi:hypothetical protein
LKSEKVKKVKKDFFELILVRETDVSIKPRVELCGTRGKN